MTNKTELLPCPFCGGKADTKCTEGDYPDWFAQCEECGASVDITGPYDLHFWNTRAAPAEDVSAEVDECEIVAIVESALRRSFTLGQLYWQQADSDSTCQQNKSGQTMDVQANHIRMVVESIRKVLYRHPQRKVAMPEKYDDVLLPFLAMMRAELPANAHKGDRAGWLSMDRKTAVLEVFYHMGKLHQAVHRDEPAAIREYAADVANMCMMLTDVCACLDEFKRLNP